MRHIKLTVAYDGTDYCGWQVQPNGLSVQEVLNRALTNLLGRETKTTGASRTDSGVHALGNVAVFTTDARMDAERFAFALNTYLPEDIKIQKSEEVPAEFHPRFAETKKTYEYVILCRTFPDPTRRRNSLFCYEPLDIEDMRQALSMLIGEHDFRSFQGAGGEASVKTTVRTIEQAEIFCESEQQEEEKAFRNGVVRIRLTGNGFLYHMVRIIVGTLLEIGKGQRSASEMQAILDACNRETAGATAPAHGLTLLGIRYPEWEA